MSLYYNKKLISGIRDIPSMTLADYNLLTNKPKLWIRTDAPDSDRGINSDDIEYSTGVSVKNKIDWTLLGSFQIFDGQTREGDWNLTNNVPASCNEICFYVTIGGGSVTNMPRNSIVIPFSIFSNYGVIYDFSLGEIRIYFNIERMSDSKFKISSTTISGTYSSTTFVYAYAR